ncbi:MAG: MFS transporter [Dehalococcoidales bacterium]|nr:MFS transporter [Dehalococcoidales bacterium]
MVTGAASHSPRYRWTILGVLWLAYIVAFMQRLCIGPLAPFLKEGLSLTSAQVGLFMSASAFGYMLTLVPAGWFVDKIGVRWLLLIGEVIGGIFIALMFTVTTFTQGLIFMALAGAGMGCLMPSTTKAVLEWFPVRERATAMGVKQTAVNVGGIITAITLPAVAISYGWHYGFLGIGLIAVVIGIVSFVMYKRPPENVDIKTSKPVTSSGTKPSVLEAFKSRDIWLLIGANMCMMIVEFSAMAYFVLYLNEVLFIAVVTAGFFLAFLEAGGILGKPISGLISDRLFRGNRKKVYMLLCSIAFFVGIVFLILKPGIPSWLIILISLVFGFGAMSWGGLSLTLVGEFAGKELAGTVTGMATVFGMLANMAGPPIFGYIVDTTGSYKMAWLLLAIMALLATVLLFFVREERRKV